MAKKYICSVCGYIHEGNEAPDQCPLCKVGKEKFNELQEEGKALEFVTEHKIGDGKVDQQSADDPHYHLLSLQVGQI